MPQPGTEPDELEELEEEPEALDDDVEDRVAPETAAGDDDEPEGSASLDELLAQRAAARRAADDDDDDDLLSLVSERDEPVRDSITTRVIPIKDRQEFVCARCHLVKAKSQLADPQRGLCRDCV